MKKLLIIIPVFNEEGNIGGLVEKLLEDVKRSPRGFSFDFIVINDASTDNTESILRKMKCSQIHLPFNLGIGGAVQTGYKYAKLLNYDYAVQMDGDGQHNFQEISKLIKQIEKSGDDFVVGSRFLEASYRYEFPFDRTIGIFCSRKILALTSGREIYDVTSGFRICNKTAISLFAKSYPKTHAGLLALINASLNGLKISEVGCVFNQRTSGTSSFSAYAAIGYCKDLLLIFLGIMVSKS